MLVCGAPEDIASRCRSLSTGIKDFFFRAANSLAVGGQTSSIWTARKHGMILYYCTAYQVHLVDNCPGHQPPLGHCPSKSPLGPLIRRRTPVAKRANNRALYQCGPPALLAANLGGDERQTWMGMPTGPPRVRGPCSTGCEVRHKTLAVWLSLACVPYISQNICLSAYS